MIITFVVSGVVSFKERKNCTDLELKHDLTLLINWKDTKENAQDYMGTVGELKFSSLGKEPMKLGYF